MTTTFAFVLVLVALALVFDYINGFHDAANSIATVVSTRVLSPAIAVVWAAFFNFVAFAVFGTRVAKAIGDGNIQCCECGETFTLEEYGKLTQGISRQNQRHDFGVC